MPDGALTSFTVTHIATLQDSQLSTSQSRSYTEYLIPTDNIIVLDITLIGQRILISVASFTTIFFIIW